MEIDDKTFEQMISQFDSYLLDDDLIECVERVIVAMNRYRDVKKIPILKGEQVWNDEKECLEDCSAKEITVVEIKLEDLNQSYKNDKWIN